MSFEYKTAKAKITDLVGSWIPFEIDIQKLDKIINDHCNQGWELVTICPLVWEHLQTSTQELLLTFKRQR